LLWIQTWIKKEIWVCVRKKWTY